MSRQQQSRFSRRANDQGGCFRKTEISSRGEKNRNKNHSIKKKIYGAWILLKHFQLINMKGQGENVYKGTTFQKMGPPVDTLFLTSPVRMCINVYKCRVLTTQRKSGLITLQIVWFSYTVVQVYIVFLVVLKPMSVTCVSEKLC